MMEEDIMGNFCRFCGKPLVNGMCDCQSTQQSVTVGTETQTQPVQEPVAQQISQENMMQQPYPQVQNTYQQPQGMYQQQMNYQQPYPQMGQPSAQSQVAKENAVKAKTLFVEAIKQPCTILYQIIPQGKCTGGAILGAVHLLLLWLCTTLNIPIPLLGDYLETGDKAKIGFILLLIAGIPVVIMSIVGLLIGKKNNPRLTFVESLGVFDCATVPGSVIFLASFLIGFISPMMAALLLLVCYFAWLFMSMEAMNAVDNGSKDMHFWIVLAVNVVCIILIVLVGKNIIMNYIEDVVGSLSDLNSLMNLF